MSSCRLAVVGIGSGLRASRTKISPSSTDSHYERVACRSRGSCERAHLNFRSSCVAKTFTPTLCLSVLVVFTRDICACKGTSIFVKFFRDINAIAVSWPPRPIHSPMPLHDFDCSRINQKYTNNTKAKSDSSRATSQHERRKEIVLSLSLSKYGMQTSPEAIVGQRRRTIDEADT